MAFASDSSESQLWLLCVGIACLNSFVQHSWTGPDLSYSATSLFSTDAFLPETVSRQLSLVIGVFFRCSKSFLKDEKQFHKNLIEQLTIDGESAYHMTPNPLFLILAKCILVKNSHHLATLQVGMTVMCFLNV